MSETEVERDSYTAAPVSASVDFYTNGKTVFSETELSGLQPEKDFLWHLREPYLILFDHDHWWQRQKPSLEAGIWEIFRRNPDMPKLIEQFTAPDEMQMLWPPPPLPAAYCLRSWPKMDKKALKFWQEYLDIRPPQRGYHPGAVSILNDFRKETILPGDESKRDPRNYLRYMIYKDRMVAAAVDHDKHGKILIAIDPLATGTGKQIERIVKNWRGSQRAAEIGKSRLGQWLNVIASFEEHELNRSEKQRRNDQLFARYRRTLHITI